MTIVGRNPIPTTRVGPWASGYVNWRALSESLTLRLTGLIAGCSEFLDWVLIGWVDLWIIFLTTHMQVIAPTLASSRASVIALQVLDVLNLLRSPSQHPTSKNLLAFLRNPARGLISVLVQRIASRPLLFQYYLNARMACLFCASAVLSVRRLRGYSDTRCRKNP